MQPPGSNLMQLGANNARAFSQRVSRITTGVLIVTAPLYVGLAALEYARHRQLSYGYVGLAIVYGFVAILRVRAARRPAPEIDPNCRALQPPFFKASTAVSLVKRSR